MTSPTHPTELTPAFVPPEHGILPRHLSVELEDALSYSRVVNVIGARQVGKTTLVRDIMQRGRFITLDDNTALEAIENDPWEELRTLRTELGELPLIVDEAQRSSKLPLAIKRIVDLNDRPGQFVITGSSNIFTTSHVADSLAGRLLTLTLWPMTVAETMLRGPSRILDWAISGSPHPGELPIPETLSRLAYIDLILRGGYPRIRNLDRRRRQKVYRDYVHTIVDRDVAHIVRVRKADALRRLIDQLAVRSASELNIAELCSLIGVQRSTVNQYLDVLLRLSLIVKLGAWTSGEARREIRNAKYHFVDTGIAAALRYLTTRSFGVDGDPAALGGLVESFVFAEILRSAPYQEHDFRFHHWRDQRGREIDILAESAYNIVAIEVKASSAAGRADFKHLDWFATKGSGRTRTVTSILFYFGERKLSFGNRRYALPVSCLWGAN